MATAHSESIKHIATKIIAYENQNSLYLRQQHVFEIRNKFKLHGSLKKHAWSKTFPASKTIKILTKLFSRQICATTAVRRTCCIEDLSWFLIFFHLTTNTEKIWSNSFFHGKSNKAVSCFHNDITFFESRQYHVLAFLDGASSASHLTFDCSITFVKK